MEFSGYLREDLGFLVRQTPINGKGNGWVFFPDLGNADPEAVIAEQRSFFEERQLPFEWKLYDFDQPPSLGAALLKQGFKEGEPEHLMVYDLSQVDDESPTTKEGIQIESAHLDQDLPSIRKLQEQQWGIDLGWLFDYIVQHETLFSFYVARDQGTIVGSGWTEFLPGSAFPELHGGLVIPDYRHRGIYSALLKIRLQEAARRGFAYMTVDAAPMSRPILERKGFVSLAISRAFTRSPVGNPSS